MKVDGKLATRFGKVKRNEKMENDGAAQCINYIVRYSSRTDISEGL